MSERIIDKLWTLSMDEIEAERKWIERQVVEMGDGNIKSLAMTAATERKKAITPLSGYHVGAALLGESKRVFSRSNMEVRVRPLGAGYAYHAEGSSMRKTFY